MELEKNMYYATQIGEAIMNLFKNEEEQSPCHIDYEELEQGDNCTEFFIGFLKAGTILFDEMTNSDNNNLEFTHILNQLCVQDLLKDKPENFKGETHV